MKTGEKEISPNRQHELDCYLLEMAENFGFVPSEDEKTYSASNEQVVALIKAVMSSR